MVNSVLEKLPPIEEKIESLKKRVSLSAPQMFFDDKDAVHIVMQPEVLAPDPLDIKLSYCFQNIRNHFKNYNTKAKYHLNSRFMAPKAEQKVINDCFAKDEELKQLMKYLNIALNDFAKNARRFLQAAQKTGYQLIINPQDYGSPNLNITFKNAKGKQSGPFLRTMLCDDRSDGYTRMSVSIGYVGKNRHKNITHYFSYDKDGCINDIVEQRGEQKYLKTEDQVLHDKFSAVKMNEIRIDLRFKHKFDRKLR